MSGVIKKKFHGEDHRQQQERRNKLSRQKNIFRPVPRCQKTLVLFLQSLVNTSTNKDPTSSSPSSFAERVRVELKNGSVIEGWIDDVDGLMNLTMSDVEIISGPLEYGEKKMLMNYGLSASGEMFHCGGVAEGRKKKIIKKTNRQRDDWIVKRTNTKGKTPQTQMDMKEICIKDHCDKNKTTQTQNSQSAPHAEAENLDFNDSNRLLSVSDFFYVRGAEIRSVLVGQSTTRGGVMDPCKRMTMKLQRDAQNRKRNVRYKRKLKENRATGQEPKRIKATNNQ
eukprot:Nk52_evm7s150 gene=Nk52_evmTU7s150